MNSAGDDFDTMITRAARSVPARAAILREPAPIEEGSPARADPADGVSSIDFDERPVEEAGYGYGV